MGRAQGADGEPETQTPRSDSALFLPRSDKPLTAGELAAELAKVPPETRVYMGFGGHADKPGRVRWGNRYREHQEFLTIEGFEFGD